MNRSLSARQEAKKHYDKVKEQGATKRLRKKRLTEKRFREFLYDDKMTIDDLRGVKKNIE